MGTKEEKKQKTRYLKIFGSEISNQIITYTDIDKSWSYPIEGIFNENERIKITQLLIRLVKHLKNLSSTLQFRTHI